ncbi:MAG: hypothetical protein NT062_38460 [Proteobacteria bacterium]|nr:hypothetical protein [Pseudomonadota bacterium]
MIATNATTNLTFESFVASANNDCPDQASPGVTSLTIIARETGGASGFLTICIPHPERANEPGRVLGADQSTADFQLVDLTGAANSCTFKMTTASAPTGTGQTEGLCDAGTSPAGFALALDGALALERTCGATIDTVDMTLTGRVAVTVP